MRAMTLSRLVEKRFLRMMAQHHNDVEAVINIIGIQPGELCRIITAQRLPQLSIATYFRIAKWLQMPLANVLRLADIAPKLADLLRLGMITRGYRPTSTHDQITAAHEAHISVAVFRRALHGYTDYAPSLRTCDNLADWLAWTGYGGDDVAYSAGMIVHYQPNGQRATARCSVLEEITPYPCACGRPGCYVPAHIPAGPRRIWRSDACRMWSKRRQEHTNSAQRAASTPPKHERPTLPETAPIVRFIAINERRIPVRF